jgi:hypothetical protein
MIAIWSRTRNRKKKNKAMECPKVSIREIYVRNNIL